MRIGVDLGGTKIEIIALDDASQETYRKRVPTPQGNYQATLQSIKELIRDCEKQQKRTADSIGIGIPGSVSPATGLIKNANSTCLIGHRLGTDMQSLLGRPVSFANDADCFALSEAIDGSGKPYNSVFGVILGTGVGGGIVINQKRLTGPNAICGEWGHNPMPWTDEAERLDRECYCGKKNCIETYLSGTGFSKAFNARYHETLNTETIWKKAKTGDPRCKVHCEQYIDLLAKALSSVINLLDPEAIILGGGVSNQESIYPSVQERLGMYVFSDHVSTVILKAKYGDSSGVRGAAWL
ncbi:MAG: ROK family protein [Neptuniibacter sp.]